MHFMFLSLSLNVLLWIRTKHWEAPAPHSLLHGGLAGVVRVEGHDLHVDKAW